VGQLFEPCSQAIVNEQVSTNEQNGGRTIVSLTKRLSAMTAVTAALALAGPVAANAAVPSLPNIPNPLAPNPNFCVKGIPDLGPFGPMGPYGPKGPYGPNGPLAGQANPLGDAATCGGLFTYIVRGGDLNSFVQGNLASVGQ
jgi:hypothetical protein